jgi:hypothetical protein
MPHRAYPRGEPPAWKPAGNLIDELTGARRIAAFGIFPLPGRDTRSLFRPPGPGGLLGRSSLERDCITFIRRFHKAHREIKRQRRPDDAAELRTYAIVDVAQWLAPYLYDLGVTVSFGTG